MRAAVAPARLAEGVVARYHAHVDRQTVRTWRRAGGPEGRAHVHGIEFTIVVIVGVCLVAGAATRVLSQRTGVPHTIALLVLGFLVGGGVELGGDAAHHDALHHALQLGVQISPNLIIFVFLPALVFESAFAMEVYGFRRNLGAILVLAVPALLVSTVLTALTVQWLTDGGWGWTLTTGLVFGALISATDPVAVVAILRDLGAPKRLGTLIEGESLMNDGTAIVVFNVLIGLLAGTSGELDFGAAGLEFLRVAAGGVAVGLCLGFATSTWLSRTFNDPMVEITLTVACAYFAMLIAEGGFHVSGVIAIVTAGLWMSGVGRSRISPEVAHFLHEFWELLAYISNTVIFLLVGLLVGSQIEAASATDLLTIVLTYAVVMVIRALGTFGFAPLLRFVGDPVTTQEAAVMTWSGLRGAVSLALALVVVQRTDIPESIRQQILLLTAGVVMLTIVVNGGTIGRLLKRFGFDKPAPGVALASVGAEASVLNRVQGRIENLSKQLRTVRWDEVEAELSARCSAVEARMASLQAQLADAPPHERAAGYWQQALAVERQSYWRQLSQGMVAPRALSLLSREIDTHLDHIGHGRLEAPPSRMREGGPLSRLLSRLHPGASFERLVLLHDLSRAEAKAASQVLEFVQALDGADAAVVAAIEQTYRAYRREAMERLEDLRTHLPEMTEAIETRLAHRIQLNMEREHLQKLVKQGVLDQEAASPVLSALEARMKGLLHGATRVRLPETAELVRRAELFRDLDDTALSELAELTDERVFAPGHLLFEAGDRGDAVYIIARGAAHVFVGGGEGEAETILDVLGGGDIVGEMALLSGEPRTASVRAATTMTVGVIRRDAFLALLGRRPELAQGVWLAFAMRAFENHMRRTGGFGQLGVSGRADWARHMELLQLAAGGEVRCERGYLFVLLGSVRVDGVVHAAPALVPGAAGLRVEAAEDCRVGLLPQATGAVHG